MVTLAADFPAAELASLWTEEGILQQVRYDGMPSIQEMVDRAAAYKLDRERHIILIARDGRWSVGWINLRKVTPICVEMHAGFIDGYRGSYAKEAALYAVDYCLNHWDAVKVYCIVASFNRPASMMLASMSFEREGCLRNALRRDGAYYDLIYWSTSRGLSLRN